MLKNIKESWNILSIPRLIVVVTAVNNNFVVDFLQLVIKVKIFFIIVVGT